MGGEVEGTAPFNSHILYTHRHACYVHAWVCTNMRTDTRIHTYMYQRRYITDKHTYVHTQKHSYMHT